MDSSRRMLASELAVSGADGKMEGAKVAHMTAVMMAVRAVSDVRSKVVVVASAESVTEGFLEVGEEMA